MAITNLKNELVGVRGSQHNEPVLYSLMQKPSMPPLPFPPSMMRTELAQKTRFDSSFHSAEDADFLLRMLLDTPFALLPIPLYVYREQGGAMTLRKVNMAINFSAKMLLKHFRHYPLHTLFEIAKIRAKQIIYHAAALCGLWDAIIARRSQAPNQSDREQYQQSLHTVTASNRAVRTQYS